MPRLEHGFFPTLPGLGTGWHRAEAFVEVARSQGRAPGAEQPGPEDGGTQSAGSLARLRLRAHKREAATWTDFRALEVGPLTRPPGVAW